MAEKFLSMQNLKFTLETRASRYREKAGDILDGRNAKTLDMVFKAAFDIADKEMRPMFQEMDHNPPELEDGQVKVHPGVRPMLKTLGEDGWISAGFPEKWGGEDMPDILLHSINYIFASSNYSASVYAGLTMGAARLILSFGSDELKEQYLPKMLAGEWQGTMALTEPESGTSLGDLVTAADPVDEEKGIYKISGEKIFISAGDHNGVDNVVHLMLARIKGAKPGVKGISLFVVPKFRPENGELVPNDVVVAQVFHKLGYRGAPITGLSIGQKDGCLGYLVGEPHRGLAYMFQMMNGARLDVGMGATSIATAAYHSALDYCRQRCQGRSVTAPKGSDQVPIIQHADVKRMLLFQRAITEGSLCLILHCGMYEDILKTGTDDKDCHLLLELLTPVAKTFPSEMAILSTSAAIQCFGGYGYCDDFPVEQHFRDTRIHPIHEGTTGIQGMDLLGRKLAMENGKTFMLLKQEISDALAAARELGRDKDVICHPADLISDLEEALSDVENTSLFLGSVAAEKGPEAFLTDAVPFLEMFGLLVIGWQWLTMAVPAYAALANDKPGKKQQRFLEGKLAVAAYFYRYELPKIKSLQAVIKNSGQMTAAVGEDLFTD